MRHRQPTPSASSDDSDASDIESCFDTDNEHGETDVDTEPTDIDSDIEGCDDADLTWIAEEDNTHPPEYYLDQENDTNESEDEEEDYSDKSVLLLDMIEAQFFRCVPFLFICRRIMNLTLAELLFGASISLPK